MILNEGLLESNFHKLFKMEKREGDNLAITNQFFFEKNPFLERAFESFANQF
jgi:hypothetical protein